MPSKRKASYSRWITGFVSLIPGAVLLVAPPTTILGSPTSQDTASFVGIVLVALGVTLVVTHFEDPDATLSGALPGVGEKLGVYARGYVLLFGVLLGGGIAFVFFMLDPMQKERNELTIKQNTLETLHTELSSKLGNLEDAGKLHETLKTRIGEEKGLTTLLASYLNNARVPMRVSLRCPLDDDDAPTRALGLEELDAGFALVPNPSQTRSRGISEDNLIMLEGTSNLQVGLYSEPKMNDKTVVLRLLISRGISDGAISTLIELENPDLFGQLCINQPEKSPEDMATETESRMARAQECIPVSGPNGTETCEGAQQ